MVQWSNDTNQEKLDMQPQSQMNKFTFKESRNDATGAPKTE